MLTVAMLCTMATSVFANIPKPVPPTSGGLNKMQGNVLGLVQWFGYAIAVGMLMYIGIKYMMASANEKADLKKGAISYVIGAILLVAASSVFGIINSIGQTITQ